MGTPMRRGLVQAPVTPVDQDGVHVAWVGTALWLVAAAIIGGTSTVADWWLWTCLAGAALGLIGLGYCLWRRGRRTRPAEDRGSPEPQHPGAGPLEAHRPAGQHSVEEH